MTQTAPLAPGILLLAVPLLMVLVSMVPTRIARRNPVVAGRLVQLAAVVGLVLTMLAAMMVATGRPSLSTVVLLGHDRGSLPLALSVLVDHLTLAILALVALLVTLIARYSTNYLAGEANQGQFFRWLALTAGAFMLVVIAGNMLMFVLAIGLTGSGLNHLLTHYRKRLPAQMVAHKKLLFSRLADSCLFVATVLLAAGAGTLSFEEIAQTVTAAGGHLPWQMNLAAWLVVAYVVLKSGQFPFHGWLLQVMEAPTPVSALLHAGIVYSGAIIVFRTHELLLAEHYALAALAVVGLMTAALASMAMLTQTAIKSSLAWSTAGQLGFMLLELGLGLFALALLHLVAHSLYKAHAFLSSGSIVDLLRTPSDSKKRAMTTPRWLAGVVVSIAVTFGMGAAWGVTVNNEPALLAVGTIVSVAVAQLLAAGDNKALLLRLLGLSVIVTAAYFGLHTLFVAVFTGDLAAAPATASSAHYVLLGAVAAVFLGLSWVQSVLIHRSDQPWVQRLYIHLYNGLYTDLPVERMVYRLWPARFRQ